MNKIKKNTFGIDYSHNSSKLNGKPQVVIQSSALNVSFIVENRHISTINHQFNGFNHAIHKLNHIWY